MSDPKEESYGEKNLRILGLQVSNFLALKAVDLRPDPASNTTEITGRNGQGKTAILTALQSALGGKRMLIDEFGETITEPLRRGARSGRIFLDIGHLTRELTVEVIFTNEDWKLVVRDANGKTMSGPQGILNKLYSAVAFDPESFMRAKPAEQVAILAKLVGIDWTALNARKDKAFLDRTIKGRELETAKAALQGFPFYADAPEDERTSQELVDALNKIVLANRDGETLKARLEARKADSAVRSRERVQIQLDISRLEKELADKKVALVAAQDREAEIGRDLLTLQTQLSDFLPQDETAARAALQAVEDNNRRFRANREHEKQNRLVQEHQHAYDAFTNELDAIEAEKKYQLEWAEFPMPGLTFKDDAVLFEGIPLNQRSSAEKSRIAVSIAAALNPKLPVVLIRNGSLYDDDAKEALKAEAQKRGLHVWMEIVDSDSPGAVVIEAGEIKQNEKGQR